MIKPRFWKRIQAQTELIFKSPFLKRMSQLERYEFLQLSHRRKFKSGEFIYHQGDPGTGLYIIEQGSVELLYFDDDSSEGMQLSVLHPPEALGAFSVDYLVKRKASARCTSDCILYGFFTSDYHTLGKRHPRIALRFLETLNIVAIQQMDLALSHMPQASLRDAVETDHIAGPEVFALLFETYDVAGVKPDDGKIR